MKPIIPSERKRAGSKSAASALMRPWSVWTALPATPGFTPGRSTSSSTAALYIFEIDAANELALRLYEAEFDAMLNSVTFNPADT